MKKAEINDFVEHLFSLHQPQLSISEKLEDYFINQLGVSVLDAQEKIEQLSRKVTGAIRFKIDGHKKEFTIPSYDFSDYNSDLLIKSSLTELYGAKDLVETKIYWREKLQNFLKEVTWRDFENIAKHILGYNGLNDIEITQASNDQGIDFWGYVSIENETSITRFQKDLKFRVIGQVKHSVTDVKVNHSKVSSFGTELNRLRKKNPPNYFTGLSDEFFQSSLPLVGLFITNSDYLPKAVDFSKDYGIIVWNGRQISEDLSNKTFLELVKDSSDELSYDKLLEVLKKGLIE